MSKVIIDESTLTSIGDAIRSKEGTTELIPPLEMPKRIEAISGGYDEGYADGAASVPKFNEWGNVRLRSLNVFNTSEAVVDFPRATDLDSFCATTSRDTDECINTTVRHLTVNCPNKIGSMGFFLNMNSYLADNTLEKVTLNIDTSEAYGMRYLFNYLYALKEIDGTPLDFTAVTSTSNLRGPFNGCLALKEVRFKGVVNVSVEMKHCPFSRDTLMSLIPCLSDNVTGQTLSLNQTAVNTAFETSPGAADGSESTEWTALVDSKPNWTISLI